jgi:hypothetical protein
VIGVVRAVLRVVALIGSATAPGRAFLTGLQARADAAGLITWGRFRGLHGRPGRGRHQPAQRNRAGRYEATVYIGAINEWLPRNL